MGFQLRFACVLHLRIKVYTMQSEENGITRAWYILGLLARIYAIAWAVFWVRMPYICNSMNLDPSAP